MQTRLWAKLDWLQQITSKELALLSTQTTVKDCYRDVCLVVKDQQARENLKSIKEDTQLMLSIFRMHLLYDTTAQLMLLGIVARKYRISNIKYLPVSLQSQITQLDEDDYTDADFKDLMSSSEI